MTALRRTSWWVAAPILAYLISVLTRGYHGILGFFEDDANYYFVIAENVLRLGRSTFDGVSITTGYHPLWFVLNLALVGLSGANRRVYVVALVFVCALLALAHALLLRRLLSRFSASLIAVEVVVLLVITRSLNITFNGMESALVMPMLAWCALETLEQLEGPPPSPRRLVWLGVLAATAALSRIDSLPFGLACGFLVIINGWVGIASAARRAAWFAVGTFPFVAYLCGNLIFTGSALTTSAQAKALASGLAWNTAVFDNLSRGDRFGFVLVSALGALLVASRLVPWQGARLRLALVILGFPFAYYGLIALRSSWQIWSWYMYPLPLAAGLSLLGCVELVRHRFVALTSLIAKGARWFLPAALLVSLALVFKVHRSRGNNEGVLHAATALRQFALTHPGRYGMGDRSGLTALELERPVVQLEGLVSDRSLLEAIRAERDLHGTLTSFGVDYLVESLPTSDVSADRCQELSEPKQVQSGAHSPKMRGTFCDALFRYDDATDGHTTLVYVVPR